MQENGKSIIWEPGEIIYEVGGDPKTLLPFQNVWNLTHFLQRYTMAQNCSLFIFLQKENSE